MNAPLGVRLKNGKSYGDGTISVSSDAFLKWAVCLNILVETADGQREV